MNKIAGIIFLSLGLYIYFLFRYIHRDIEELVVCDVSQGSALLYTQGNMQVLIDVGPRYDLLVNCLDKYLPYNDRTIELVILSHADYDHVGGILRLNDRYKIKEIFINKAMLDEFELISNLRIIADGVSVLSYKDEINFSNISLTIIKPQSTEVICNHQPEDRNLCSQVIQFCRKQECGLVTGDYPMLRLANVDSVANKQIKWMTAPHHGSRYLWDSEVLKMFAHLQTVYISVGVDNRYGHPDPVFISDLQGLGLAIRRTDREGDLSIEIPD